MHAFQSNQFHVHASYYDVMHQGGMVDEVWVVRIQTDVVPC